MFSVPVRSEVLTNQRANYFLTSCFTTNTLVTTHPLPTEPLITGSPARVHGAGGASIFHSVPAKDAHTNKQRYNSFAAPFVPTFLLQESSKTAPTKGRQRQVRLPAVDFEKETNTAKLCCVGCGGRYT